MFKIYIGPDLVCATFSPLAFAAAFCLLTGCAINPTPPEGTGRAEPPTAPLPLAVVPPVAADIVYARPLLDPEIPVIHLRNPIIPGCKRVP